MIVYTCKLKGMRKGHGLLVDLPPSYDKGLRVVFGQVQRFFQARTADDARCLVVIVSCNNYVGSVGECLWKLLKSFSAHNDGMSASEVFKPLKVFSNVPKQVVVFTQCIIF